MKQTIEKHTENAVLVGVITGKIGNEYTSEATMIELAELAKTAGANVVGSMVQHRPAIETATYIGEGKLRELADFCINNEIDVVIFDDELTGSQQRNIENAIKTRVIDRSTLILDIFASRASSSEGKLQVELAQLKYRLPRLGGQGAVLSRLGGGIGTRGPGETQLETDKRHIRRRIETLENELKEVEKRRSLARTRRVKDGFQSAVLVGYTNAGKSTIMNLLTDAGVLSENMLFATLDPTARALELNDGKTVMLLDTVGFIRKLPHHLIKAFRSTLEEAVYADLLIIVNDISSPEYKIQLEVSRKLLNELGCENKPVLLVYNKCDVENVWQKSTNDQVFISAKENKGIYDLMNAITAKMSLSTRKMKLLIPYNDASLTSKLRDEGKVLTEEYMTEGIEITVIIDKMYEYKYGKYEIK
ncbi:MAG: GTPase HflX [Clostridia bacterium]|nr:GTPase HflX [Clostridia bacterium]